MPEFAHATEPALVRDRELRNADVRLFDGGQTVCLATALGPPRLWGYGLDALFEGLSSELEAEASESGRISVNPEPPNFERSSRLHRALDAGCARLRARTELLIERRRCDVAVLLLSFSSGQLQVLSAGPMRVYVRRTTQVRRVNTREDREEGLLGIRPALYTERVEPGDLLVAGSRAVFNSESVERVGQALAQAPNMPVAQLVALLHESSVKRGGGGGALALRFPQF